MTRFSGLHLLALSVALWGLAVWRLGTPDSAATADTATVQTEVGPAEQNRETGSGAARAPLAEADGGGVPATPSTPVEDPVPDTRIAAVSPPSDPARPAPGAVIPPSPSSESPFAPEPTWGVPRHPETPGGRAAPSPGDVPREPAYPQTRYDYPPAYSMPPSRPGGGANRRGNVVAHEFSSARRAAWEGRLADAVDHYRAAARILPGNYEVWGEMGNVLWQMGRWPEAAYALEGAATLLVQAGELQTASGLVPAVGSLNPDAARRIQERVRAALQRYPG